MKSKQSIQSVTLSAALLLLTACAEDVFIQRTMPGGSQPIAMTASGADADGETKQMRSADGLYNATTGFDGGEQVVAYLDRGGTSYGGYYDVGEPDAAHKSELAYNSGYELVYPIDQASSSPTVTLYGVYPAASVSQSNGVPGTAGSHTVAYNQTNTADGNANYKSSDLMYARTPVPVTWSSVADKQEAVNLPFAHQLVKLKLSVVKAADVYQVTKVSVANVKRTQAITAIGTTAMTLGDVTSAADGDGDAILLSEGETGSNAQQTYTYCCLFPIQRWVGTDFITIEADDQTAVFQLSKNDWIAGREYALTLNLNAETLGATSTIVDWDTTKGTCLVLAPTTGGGSFNIRTVETMEYTGSELEPTPDVYSKNEDGTDKDKLTKDTQYTMQWFSNTDAGEGIIVVTGKDGTDYAGKVGVRSFEITQRPIKVTANNQDVVYGSVSTNFHSGGMFYLTTSDKVLPTGQTIDATLSAKEDDGTKDVSDATPVGATYTIIPSDAVIKASDLRDITANYEVTYQSGKLTIAQRPVTLTAVDGQIQKDDEDTYGSTTSGKTFTNLTGSTYTNYVTASTGTDQGLASGHYVYEVKVTPDNTSVGSTDSKLTPSAAVIWDSNSQDVTSNYDINYVDGTLTVVTDPGVALANSAVGDIVGSNGKAYKTTDDLPTDVTIIGMVACKNGSSGIVLAKSNTTSSGVQWSNRNNSMPSSVDVYVNNLTTTTSKSWTCGTAAQYQSALTGTWTTSVPTTSTKYTASAINSRLSSAGCDELGSSQYWSSTQSDSEVAWGFAQGSWYGLITFFSNYVRPLFAF